jgi:AraC-like DNA-binding protein
MFEKTIYLLTALLGFITLLLIGFRYKTNRHSNLYFIVFLLLSNFRFLAHGLIDELPIADYTKQIDASLSVIAWPLLYLYFKKIVNSQCNLKGYNLLHFVLPILLFLLVCFKHRFTNVAFEIGKEIVLVFAILLNISYSIVTYKLLSQNVWKRKSNIEVINQQNKIVKQWTQILFGLFSLMLIRYILNLAVNKTTDWYVNQNNFLWMGAIIWIVMYIKILYSPEFLYGHDVFQNKIKEYKKHAVIFDNIWIFKTVKDVTNLQDMVLKEKMEYNIEKYVLSIEHIALNTNLFFTENFDTRNLANKIGIPKSYLLYIFKYHASISFNDFRKIIRIQKTILLIEDGYLKKDTLESLASVAGFTSYSSFFKSFKSITGLSPQEFIRS